MHKQRQDFHLQEDCCISLESIEVVLVKGEEGKKAILDPSSARTEMFCVVDIGTHSK